MNVNKLSSACLILVGIILFGACSPVKIASIEKRRYRDGYYVQMKHEAPKAEIAKGKTAMTSEETSASVNTPGIAKKVSRDKNEFKKLKTALGELKKSKNREQFVAAVNDMADKVVIFDTQKNLTSIPEPGGELQNQDTLKPVGPKRFGTGESAIVLLVVLALLLILLMKEVLVAILIAIVLALLIIWLLRELDMID